MTFCFLRFDFPKADRKIRRAGLAFFFLILGNTAALSEPNNSSVTVSQVAAPPVPSAMQFQAEHMAMSKTISDLMQQGLTASSTSTLPPEARPSAPAMEASSLAPGNPDSVYREAEAARAKDNVIALFNEKLSTPKHVVPEAPSQSVSQAEEISLAHQSLSISEVLPEPSQETKRAGVAHSSSGIASSLEDFLPVETVKPATTDPAFPRVWAQQLQALERENQALRQKLHLAENDRLGDIRVDAVANIREEVLRARIDELENALNKQQMGQGLVLPQKTGLPARSGSKE